MCIAQIKNEADMVELVDTPDLGSGNDKLWGFESLCPHQNEARFKVWRLYNELSILSEGL